MKLATHRRMIFILFLSFSFNWNKVFDDSIDLWRHCTQLQIQWGSFRWRPIIPWWYLSYLKGKFKFSSLSKYWNQDQCCHLKEPTLVLESCSKSILRAQHFEETFWLFWAKHSNLNESNLVHLIQIRFQPPRSPNSVRMKSSTDDQARLKFIQPRSLSSTDYGYNSWISQVQRSRVQIQPVETGGVWG